MDDVSFEMKRGETLGIVGESGCGKTTCGRTVIGLYDKTDGAVLYKGKDVVFVYLAFKDQESSWKKAVEQEGLSEVPDNFLITNPKNSKILEKLKLELIPRYIIFDKQGNIVEVNAPRPSDQQAATTIDKYLKQ